MPRSVSGGNIDLKCDRFETAARPARGSWVHPHHQTNTRKGWIRVLVSLSLIWMIGSTLYVASRFTDNATRFAEGPRWMCEQGNASLVRDFSKYAHLADCTSDRQKNYRIGLGGDYSYGDLLGLAAMFAFGGLLLAWLLGGGLVIIARWVHRGFLRSKQVGWCALALWPRLLGRSVAATGATR